MAWFRAFDQELMAEITSFEFAAQADQNWTISPTNLKPLGAYNLAQLDAQSDAISFIVAIAKLEAQLDIQRHVVQPILSLLRNSSLFSKLNENAIGITRFKILKSFERFCRRRLEAA
jgi:hypothetical protein